MMRQTLIDACNRISAAGIRNFKQGDIGILFEELEHIDDNCFKRLVDEYIRLDYHSKSFSGWFLNRSREINYENTFLKQKCTTGWVSGEYPKEAQVYFFRCLAQALRLWNGLSGEYDSWCAWFNEKWIELNGEVLVNHPKKHFETLKKTTTIRKEQSKIFINEKISSDMTLREKLDALPKAKNNE